MYTKMHSSSVVRLAHTDVDHSSGLIDKSDVIPGSVQMRTTTDPFSPCLAHAHMGHTRAHTGALRPHPGPTPSPLPFPPPLRIQNRTCLPPSLPAFLPGLPSPIHPPPTRMLQNTLPPPLWPSLCFCVEVTCAGTMQNTWTASSLSKLSQSSQLSDMANVLKTDTQLQITPQKGYVTNMHETRK